MTWEITNKTPAAMEGDKGQSKMTFDIEWNGTVDETVNHIWLNLSIDKLTTSFGEVRFENGNSKAALVLEKGVYKGSVTVVWDGDKTIEDTEVFGVSIDTAFWYHRDPGTGKLDTDPPEIKVGETAHGIIINDDDPAAPKTIDTAVVKGEILTLVKGGKIDDKTGAGLLGELEGAGGGSPKGGNGEDDKKDGDDKKGGDSGEDSGEGSSEDSGEGGTGTEDDDDKNGDESDDETGGESSDESGGESGGETGEKPVKTVDDVQDTLIDPRPGIIVEERDPGGVTIVEPIFVEQKKTVDIRDLLGVQDAVDEFRFGAVSPEEQTDTQADDDLIVNIPTAGFLGTDATATGEPLLPSLFGQGADTDTLATDTPVIDPESTADLLLFEQTDSFDLLLG